MQLLKCYKYCNIHTISHTFLSKKNTQKDMLICCTFNTFPFHSQMTLDIVQTISSFFSVLLLFTLMILFIIPFMCLEQEKSGGKEKRNITQEQEVSKSFPFSYISLFILVSIGLCKWLSLESLLTKNILWQKNEEINWDYNRETIKS